MDGQLSGVVVSKAENPSSMTSSVPSSWKQGFWLWKQRPRKVMAVQIIAGVSLFGILPHGVVAYLGARSSYDLEYIPNILCRENLRKVLVLMRHRPRYCQE